MGENLKDMGTGEIFLNRTAMACAVRSRIQESTNGTLYNCKASVRQRTLSIRPKGNQLIEKRSLPIINLIKEKVGESLEYIGHRRKVPQQKTNGLRSKIKNQQWDLIKLLSFHKAMDTVNRTKQQPTDLEKIFTNPTSDRGLISNINKELKKLDFRESNNPIKNGVKSS